MKYKTKYSFSVNKMKNTNNGLCFFNTFQTHSFIYIKMKFNILF